MSFEKRMEDPMIPGSVTLEKKFAIKTINDIVLALFLATLAFRHQI